MPAAHHCAACGFEGDNFPAGVCPQCGKKLSPARAFGPWIAAAVQSAVAAAFMLAFHFPRPMIGVFVAFIVLGTALSNRFRRTAASRPKAKLPPQPFSVQLLGIAIGVCGFAFFSTALFGFVMFMNSWQAWHRFEGHPYHAATFEVSRVYYQRVPGMHGPTVSIYANGWVEGKKEWMDLYQYLNPKPHDQAELESRVPPGTTIPIYLFSDLKGRTRVQPIAPLPPDVANRKEAMAVLNRGLTMLATLGGLLFALIFIRRSRLQSDEPTMASAAGA